MTPDDVITMIAGVDDATARAILSARTVRMLRRVADLMYAVDYPDAHGKPFLIRAILESR